jgi:hypothetical protein
MPYVPEWEQQERERVCVSKGLLGRKLARSLDGMNRAHTLSPRTPEIISYSLHIGMPVAVTEPSEPWAVFDRSEAVIARSNPTLVINV